MSKRILAIILLISCLLFLYYGNLKRNNNSIWDLVPSKSIILLEADNPFNKWLTIKEKITNSNFYEIIKSSDDDIKKLDDFLNNKLEIFSQNNKLIISYIESSNDKIEPIFLAYKNNLDLNYILNKLDSNGYKLSERKYDGQYIYEAEKNKEKHVFLVVNNVLAYSENAFLIEDIVRTSNDKTLQYKHLNSELFEQVKLKNDLGNLYINLPDIIKFFSSNSNQKLVDHILNILPNKSFFDISFNNKMFYLNGFSSIQNESFNKENNIVDSMIYILPNNTILYSNTNSSNFKNYVYLNNLNDSIGNKLSNFFTYEIGRFLIESSQSNSVSEVIIIKEKNNYVYEKYDSIEYKGNKILNIEDKLINDFLIKINYEIDEEIYMYKNKEYVFISTDIFAIKEYINKVINKEFWSREIIFYDFNSELNNSQNITLIFQLDKLSTNLNLKLKENLNYLGLASIQLTSVDDKFYTSINIKEKQKESGLKANYKKENIFSSKSNFIIKPNIIFSHLDNKPEVITQDENNIVYQLSENLNKIWSDSIESKIISKIHSIDYYKNNKKQILFSTKYKIHSYDRKGNKLIGFPINNPSKSDIKYLNIIDYDNSKRYRIVIATEDGNIFFLDKNGKQLNGWNPMSMQDELTQAPMHYRIKGKDYIIIMQKNGKLYLKNRKGENYSGFPVIIGNDVSNKIYVNTRTTKKNSIIKVLDDSGKLYNITFEGKVNSIEENYRSIKTSIFKMVLDALGKTPIIISLDDQKIYKGDYSLDFNNKENTIFQYYNFGRNQEILIFTDQNQKKSFFYNLMLENYMPSIANDNELSILYKKDVFKVYTSFNNTLSMIEIKK